MKQDSQGYFTLLNGDIYLFGHKIGYIKMHTIDIFLIYYKNHIAVTFGRKSLDVEVITSLRHYLKQSFFDFLEIVEVNETNAHLKMGNRNIFVSKDSLLYALCEYHWLKDKPLDKIELWCGSYLVKSVEIDGLAQFTHSSGVKKSYDDYRDFIWEQRVLKNNIKLHLRS